jgi:hypothetical protein
MVNYTLVWPSAHENAPEVAANVGWARWPAVFAGEPSRAQIGDRPGTDPGCLLVRVRARS